MAQTRLRLSKQLQQSSSPASILYTNSDNELTYLAPPGSDDVIPFYDHSGVVIGWLSLGPGLEITGTTLDTTSSTGYGTIQEEGVTVGSGNSTINFIGAGVTAADAGSGVTSITIDATLNALAGLDASAGLVTQTAADTFTKRTLTGTTDRITVNNGTGASGNPTVDIASTYVGQNTITTLGTITTGTWNGVVIADEYGGTGQSTYAQGDILYASAANTLSKLTIGGNGTVLQSNGTVPSWQTLDSSDLSDGADIAHIDENETISASWTFSNVIVASAAPTLGTHLTNKTYVDSLFQGVRDYKESVRLASTANVAITYSATGGSSGRGQITDAPDTLNGSTLVANDRILLKNQSTGAQNGIWVVTTVGTGANGVWDRATDFDADVEVTSGATTYVSEYTTTDNRGTYVLTTADPIIIGGGSGTALTFTLVDSPTGYVAGDGLTLSSLTFNVGTASSARIVVNADNIDLATTAVTPGSYGSATQVGTFTVDAYGRLTAAGNTSISIPSTAVSDFTEAVQDVVGNASFLLEGDGITITYNDGANTLTIEAANIYNSDGTIPAATTRTVSFADTDTTLLIENAATGVLLQLTDDSATLLDGVFLAQADLVDITTTGVAITADSTGLQIETSGDNADLYTFTDNRATTKGIEYAADYSAGFTNRTLVDKQYVDDAVSGATTTVNRYFVEGSTASTIDLDVGGGVIKDVDGNDETASIPTDHNLIKIFRNGQLLNETGDLTTRDYSLNDSTHVITLTTALTASEVLMIEITQ